MGTFPGVTVERTIELGGATVPTFFYGTAWKEDDTRRCVEAAIAAGFRAIDTANQRKHYFEAGVGEAIGAAIGRGDVTRDDLFLQTKFTFRPGQDDRLPYDPNASITEQVEQSFASSLEHLGVETIDSLVLHGPTTRRGLGSPDWEAWTAMEALHAEGKTRLIGISNVTAAQLDELCGLAKRRPAFVQNRCYASQGWDAATREVCARHGVAYQGFSLLTANGRELRRPEVHAIAQEHGRTLEQVVFRFALQLGMIPLTGTTDPAHMAQDLEAYDFALSDAEVDTLRRAG